MKPVLVLGGYGNFARRIVRGLARHRLPVIIAGRDAGKAEALADAVMRETPDVIARGARVDADGDIGDALRALTPSVAVNACGPFQTKDYRVAAQCIEAGIHYVDIADGRDFVTGFSVLDARAKAANVCAITGASVMPGLSSAVLDSYANEFLSLDSLDFGISPSQKSERGLATMRAILSYLGKPLKPAAGENALRHGWGDPHLQKYPTFGRRWVANCDVPDLDLLPRRYGLKRIRFSSGIESPTIFWSTWLLGRLIRAGLPLDLPRYASLLSWAAELFDRFGSDIGGMHVIMKGTGQDGAPHERRWFLIAEKGEGPQIPAAAAINLARRLHAGEKIAAGARPCVGLVSLDYYLGELTPFFPIWEAHL